MRQSIFIIEHLEPKLWDWCLIEYKHISKIVGKNNIWFTNIKNKKEQKILKKIGVVFEKSVKDLDLEDACVLDPSSSISLNPSNSKKFKYFIFGGILGDNPPKNRTETELSRYLKKIPKFNIGKEQMSTDNAVYVVKNILNGTPLKNINFVKGIEIKINKIESVILPYKYAVVKGKPFISKDIVKYLKKNTGF